jgi:hypothetical protein
MVCPTCGKDNPVDAAFCGRCGTQLDRIVQAGPAEVAVATPPGWPAPPASSEEPQISHRGTVYGAGFGPTFFAVWPLAGGPPVATFSRDQTGWEAAWRRFQRLEGDTVVPGWRRPKVGWVLLHVVIGFAMWFALLVIEGVVLAGVGRDTSDLSDLATAGALLALPAAMTGWMLFVYLHSSSARRGFLLGLVGAGLFASVALGIAGQPAS